MSSDIRPNNDHSPHDDIYNISAIELISEICDISEFDNCTINQLKYACICAHRYPKIINQHEQLQHNLIDKEIIIETLTDEIKNIKKIYYR